MNQLITLLKNKTVLWSLVIAVLSVLQGYLFEFNLTPVHQMIAGIIISVVVVLLRFIETPKE
jgi:uncharacterized membrane protein AbrB (regulator of aidB expression)